ncbi:MULTISPECIES: hypothetical protein [unclassified Streptomyces]|uniref:hypothetical protein n=1 Tax=unclassified Streptomyces TaxID=2593676 RepID=UPI0011CE12F8|nr:hypothetical protein [Streptomyces sp. me109]
MEKLVKDLERAVFSGGFTFFGAREVDGSEVTAAFADGYTAQGLPGRSGRYRLDHPQTPGRHRPPRIRRLRCLARPRTRIGAPR